ncbi:MAG: M23 family metallopeptidase [Deltaproteobacteria bacterium]|nr:M23 family metallopeptidase [Deltaproteobacteria bacterium]
MQDKRRLVLIIPLFCILLSYILACPSPKWNIIEEENIIEGEDGVYHTVSKGENLYRISKAYNVDLQEIAEINGIEDINQIKIGQKIFIPGAKEIKKVEIIHKSEEKKVNNENLNVNGIREEKKEVTRKDEHDSGEIKTFKGRFIWPVKGKVISYFGVRGGRNHKGIDIAAPEGTKIVASESGTVIYSDDKLRNYGNVIIIKHHGNFITVYAHNKINYVKENDEVKKGQEIGEVGRTGNAETPHLHFEIRDGVKARNPLFYLP